MSKGVNKNIQNHNKKKWGGESDSEESYKEYLPPKTSTEKYSQIHELSQSEEEYDNFQNDLSEQDEDWEIKNSQERRRIKEREFEMRQEWGQEQEHEWRGMGWDLDYRKGFKNMQDPVYQFESTLLNQEYIKSQDLLQSISKEIQVLQELQQKQQNLIQETKELNNTKNSLKKSIQNKKREYEELHKKSDEEKKKIENEKTQLQSASFQKRKQYYSAIGVEGSVFDCIDIEQEYQLCCSMFETMSNNFKMKYKSAAVIGQSIFGLAKKIKSKFKSLENEIFTQLIQDENVRNDFGIPWILGVISGQYFNDQNIANYLQDYGNSLKKTKVFNKEQRTKLLKIAERCLHCWWRINSSTDYEYNSDLSQKKIVNGFPYKKKKHLIINKNIHIKNYRNCTVIPIFPELFFQKKSIYPILCFPVNKN
ncbi:cilia and flagella-associated protein [Anaeramoeba flamelloides]|uniref:Cilia and flagella-associated protein n=1 Tax=Anaeramoeba flamelloides TaxID=1746091 RepID=A0ABQ8Y782_9EUKA|nr:cilia and flagella-associated protein [Anaeramoeba flamelloides]